MRTKLSLTLADAEEIAAAAQAYAESHAFLVSIAVVDEATYLQHLIRMDGAPYTSAEGALEKARTAAEGGYPTTFFEDQLNAGRFSMLKMPLYPIEGGIPVIVDGQCVGAIGVSGVPPQFDAAIANAGLEAVLSVAR
ncbi:MAG: heme-binding protein [Dermatophilaceae bacterium]